jgi:hypothetical protein
MAKKLKDPNRSFGVSVGTVLLLIGVALWWRGRPVRAEVIGSISGVLLILGLVQPRLLQWPSAIWWKFSRALGYVNARILLTVLFSLLLAPLSFIWRITGKDPLNRRRASFHGWIPYSARYRDRRHFQRMF